MNKMDVLIVEALYPYKAKNNDELCFKKGSVITVTQNDDETWWEGTLDGNTGWFPANYVRPCKSPGLEVNSGTQSNTALSPNSEQQMYRALVLRNLLDSERQHIMDLTSLLDNCLKPLSVNKPLSVSEYTTLLNDLEDIVTVHKELLAKLETEGQKSSADQRVGGVFLSIVGELLTVPHQKYCCYHPKVVSYLQEHKTEIEKCVESSSMSLDSEGGHKKPGLLVLTTGLSKPFRRLQQYSGLLQELHRHLPEAHRDRGDASRAAKVMADLAANCTALRRQKELELEVVTGQIAGWEKGTLGVLGEVQLMGSVAVLPQLSDRYLVLFPKHLIILGVSPRMSNFIFQAQHNLTDIKCNKLEDCDQYKNAFELSGPKMERLVAVCQSKTDQLQWVSFLSTSKPLLQQTQPVLRSSGLPPVLPAKAPPLPPTNHLSVSTSSRVSSRQSIFSHKSWGLCDLRPSPPLRPQQLRKARNARKDENWHKDDSIILRVVEAYCSSAGATKYTQGQGHDSFTLEERRIKSSASNTSGNLWEDRNMAAIVSNLKNEIERLNKEQDQLRRQFESERQQRHKLESAISHLLPQN